MPRPVILLQLWLVSAVFGAEPTAAQLARAVRETAADPAECYRVRDLSFAKEDIRIYLNEGYLIFSKPIDGRRVWAAFSSDVDGGDGEVILFPPTRSERQSLAGFTQSPNLDEHLRSAFMVFTDGSAERLLEQIQREGTGRKAPEMGASIASEWSPIAANIAAPMQMRLVEDILAPAREGSLVFLAFSGKSLGNFDILMDGREGNQIVARQRTERNGKPAYDVWTSFPARSVRNGNPAGEREFTLSDYRIDASIDALLHVQAVTKVTVHVGAKARRVFSFAIANAMQVRSVKIDGVPAEVLAGDSVRGRIAGESEEQPLLIVVPRDLEAKSQHEFEFEHLGNVITSAGDGVYFVKARGSWYPHIAAGAATFDLRFRYPRRLTLVTAGDPVDERLDGDWRVTERRISVPVSAAGFNLGDYEKVVIPAPGIAIDVYGNRHVEDSLRPRVIYMPVPPADAPFGRRGRGRGMAAPPIDPIPIAPPPPDPLGRLKAVAADMSSSMEFYANLFGPPAIKHVTVAPIPGTFGQGFPGLVYMSTIAYLDAQDRPAALRSAREQVFYSDLIVPHEAAHQWWGTVVSIEKNNDAWLLEGLANYSALMWLEKKKGPKELQTILDRYRGELLDDASGKGTPDSSGPIVWGDRLMASEIPDAWRAVTYAKGTWILHMMRKRLGDERFLSMLAELRKRFEFKVLTTESFRALAIEFRPKGTSAEAMETFFDNWVYSSGVPSLKLKYSIKAGAVAVALTGTLEQTGVDDDFSVDVPVDVQFARGVVQTIWVRSSGGETPFSATLRQTPSRVAISDDILTKK